MPARPLYCGTCTVHRRLSYTSRKRARLHARRVHPGDNRMNAYQCDDTGLWHLGRLPGPVVGGKTGRHTIINDRYA